MTTSLGFRRGVSTVLLATLGSSGCAGYVSSYVPPDDGYARLVWDGSSVAVVGTLDLPSCTPSQWRAMPRGDVRPPMLHVGLRSGPDPWFLSLELDTRHDDDEGSSDSKLVILLMAAATLVAAGAAIGIAASPAGQGDEIAATIDAVNYHNDQVAWRLAQCRAKGVDTP